MNKPWLSVIMPVFNGSEYLREALDGVVAQQADDIEVLVIDDGSTDDSVGIVRGYADRLPVRLLERAHSGNWVANTNVAMREARGAYVCWLHQDDVWDAARLAALRERTRTRPDVAFLAHASWYIDSASRKLAQCRCPLPSGRVFYSSAEVIAKLLVQNSITPSATIFKASAAAEIGPLDSDLWYTADWDYWIRLAALGPVAFDGRALSYCRVHRASQTMLRLGDVADLEAQYAEVLRRHLPRWQTGDIAEPAVARAARYSALANVALMKLAARDFSGLAVLCAQFIGLGPHGWHCYLRDSRIAVRAIARLRAGLGAPTAKAARLGARRVNAGAAS